MQRLVGLIVAAGAIASVHMASAADLPAKTPAYKAPVAANVPPGWAGFYLGVAGGYGWGQAEQTDSTPFSSGTYDTNGAVIGGTLGYNWQSGPMVYGLETDLSYAKVTGSTVGTDPASGTCATVTAPHCESTISVLGTVRARVGYAWDKLLPYLTGGLAYAKLDGLEGVTGNGGSGSSWVAGWTVGAGIEAALAPRWSAKIEYLYVDLGDHSAFDDVFVGVTVPQSLRTTASVVRLGINYRFGGL
jgi:outer membrane immunogenic protein